MFTIETRSGAIVARAETRTEAWRVQDSFQRADRIPFIVRPEALIPRCVLCGSWLPDPAGPCAECGPVPS